MIDRNQHSFESFDELIQAAPEEAAPASAPVVFADTSVPALSSLTIAEITGKNHKDVMRDIRNILEQAEIDERKFALTYKDAANREQPCYYLPRFECDLVVSGYSVKYRAAIIKRWHELEAKQVQRDPMEILKDPTAMRGLLLTYSEKVIALETTVSELTPKADALERISGTAGKMNITTAAKTLQISPKTLFQYLDTNGWTYRRPGAAERIPYQTKISQGLMTMKVYAYTNTTTGEEGTKESSYITPKGLAKLAQVFGKEAPQA